VTDPSNTFIFPLFNFYRLGINFKMKVVLPFV
jgi:hypothetical protein